VIRTSVKGERPVVDGATYAIAKAKAYATGLHDAAAAARVGGAEPDRTGYEVLRWSSARHLAEKALTEFDYQTIRYGRRLRIVPVD
jgi:hypothetical protein